MSNFPASELHISTFGTHCSIFIGGVNKNNRDEIVGVFIRKRSVRKLPELIGRSGPGSSIGIATGYGLDGPGIESRWRRDFPHLSRSAWGRPSLLHNGYRIFPKGNEGPGRAADPSPLSSAVVKKE